MVDRDEKGRWAKGTPSPNPKGREPGTSRVHALRSQLIGAIPNVVKAMYDAAVRGDVNAAKLVLERTMPALRSTDLPLVPMSMAGGLSEQARGILQQVADGELSPGVAAELLSNLGTAARVIEADEIVQRLEAVERRLAADAERGES